MPPSSIVLCGLYPNRTKEPFSTSLRPNRASFPAVPVAIGGEVKMRDETLARECPSETSLKVADVSLANETDAKAAMENAVASKTNGEGPPAAKSRTARKARVPFSMTEIRWPPS